MPTNSSSQFGRFSFFPFGVSLFWLAIAAVSCQAEQRPEVGFVTGALNRPAMQTGAERTDFYFPLLKDKKVAVCTNHSAMVKTLHLVDTLLAAGIQISKIFGPEHGFRGQGDAGEKMDSGQDTQTGLPVVSLYGANKKPTTKQLEDTDIMVFDIQDVGARFYTFISTLHFLMEACAENDIPLIVLDRPNPNGYYVDGPVREPAFKSFVGMHPIPVVHGLTIGELALMINGEGWLTGGKKCNLTVIPIKGYDHKTVYQLKIPPSPNLNTPIAVSFYPSLCLFEGTIVSVGRGTDWPFTVYGYPNCPSGNHQFTPNPGPGSKDPMYSGVQCRGYDLIAHRPNPSEISRFNLSYLIDLYKDYQQPAPFFKDPKFFDLLCGTDQIRKSIQSGATEAEIRKSWQPKLAEYKQLRRQYLLYPDFE